MAIEGERPIRELLEDADAVDHWRSEFVRIGAPMLGEFAVTDTFKLWLSAANSSSKVEG